ncbi:MAG: prepilin-type N-terminal cleavage/methylation domain-containing protein [Minisyncoccia bacterium]
MEKGFTLIELLLVLALMIVAGVVVFMNLGSRRIDVDLVATTQQIGTLLRQAQSDAMAQESDVAWGVHFSNATSVPFYALFKTSYSTTTVAGGPYRLPPTVAYATSTLAPGATLDVIFSSISGTASVSTTVGLYMPKENTAFSSTISIASSGSVSF